MQADREFLLLVKAMREQQRAFFAGDRAVVAEAKRLERLVDRAVAEIERGQPSLFPEG